MGTRFTRWPLPDCLIAAVAVAGGGSILLQVELSALLTPLATFLIPPAALALWLYRRRLQSRPRVSWILKLTVVGGWVLSFIPGLFWGALFFYIYEPWPFSLAQGPDTEFADEGFRQVMGWPPQDVSDVYYKGYNIRDRDAYLRFDSCDSEIESRVLDGLEVQPDGEQLSAFHQNDRLSWWLEPDQAVLLDRYAADLSEVWIDRSSCRFYVRSWTF